VNKVYVITGATSGIGRATALGLAKADANLVLVGRNPRRGSEVAERIRKKAANASVWFIEADLSAQKDVRRLAKTIGQEYDHVDALINNAGARFDTYGETEDGLERTFATNHLGHFLLSCLLLEHLIEAPSARIITVSSESHRAAKTDGVWLYQKHKYDRRQAYAKSKLANILFASELARRLARTGVISNAVNPGGVATHFARNNGLLSWLKHLAAHGVRRELISPAKGADTIVCLADTFELAAMSGRYFFQRRSVDPAPAALDRSLAAALWNLSLEWTELDKSIGLTWEYIKPVM
jgi:NAD(P)-dependent dehydrogenase (short-subunit alcohol dehydrogenase family)